MVKNISGLFRKSVNVTFFIIFIIICFYAPAHPKMQPLQSDNSNPFRGYTFCPNYIEAVTKTLIDLAVTLAAIV